MSTVKKDGVVTITCDKCKAIAVAPEDSYNTSFFLDGWILNRGRKYMHLCWGCQTKKQRAGQDFVRERFNLTR